MTMSEVWVWGRVVVFAVLLVGVLGLVLAGVAVWLVSGNGSLYRLDDGEDLD